MFPTLKGGESTLTHNAVSPYIKDLIVISAPSHVAKRLSWNQVLENVTLPQIHWNAVVVCGSLKPPACKFVTGLSSSVAIVSFWTWIFGSSNP